MSAYFILVNSTTRQYGDVNPVPHFFYHQFITFVLFYLLVKVKDIGLHILFRFCEIMISFSRVKLAG